MIRALLAFLLLAAPARAQPAYPCPQISFGWSQQWWNQPISSASYDSVSQLLYVVFSPPSNVSAFSNVPLNVFSTFAQAGNPLSFYSCCVLPRYHALLLSTQNNCPILFETGAYIWTD
jgi:hypothetical protein